jgi:hypothetical protein
LENYKIYIVLGILGILFSLVVLAAGIDYYFFEEETEETSEEENKNTGSTMFVCTPIIIIPSILFFVIGYRQRQTFHSIQDVADMLKAYRRIKISKIAQKLGKSEMEAEKMVLECIEKNLIQGYMDRQEGAFFTNDYMTQMTASKQGWKCPACGGYNDSIILPGEAAKCHYCGKLLPSGTISGGPSAPRSAPPPTAVPPPPQPQPVGGYSLPPGPPPQTQATTCQYCRGPLNYISQYGRWYCNYCRRYA